MPKIRRQKTLADYAVIAISPVLLMTLVGSLTFFLLELFYHGEFELRLKWILFWFVFASVLVARIGIEQGTDQAKIFGSALTVAVGFAALCLVDRVLLAWALIAVIWWCTWKLTWDCTLIDDNEDASGEGLLQAAGLDAATEAKPSNRPVHAPGKWLVYFSLAALPIFGAGQLLIPSLDTERREYGFHLLILYVASALGLLLTTSFLGLRRYLRQRKLQMPSAVTRAWLGLGAALAISLLCLALFLPQPQGEYSLTALVDKVDAKVRDASQFALLPEDRGKAKGEGRRIGARDPQAPGQNAEGQGPQPGGQIQGNRQQPGGNQKGKAQERGKGQKSAGKGDEKTEQRSAEQDDKRDDQKQNSDENDRRNDQQQSDQQQANRGEQHNGEQKQNDQKQADRRQAGGQFAKNWKGGARNSTPSPRRSSTSPLARLMQLPGSWFKWLIYAVLAVIAVFVAIRHWPVIRDFFGRLWTELLTLLGLRREEEQAAPAGIAAPPPVPARPFSSYADPFFSGAASRMSTAQLVGYTFEALEAWSREQVVARPPEQTPLEFADELGRRVPALAKDVSSTAELYVRVAYARRNPTREAVQGLERLWRRMGMSAGAVSAPEGAA